jgi:hypothetical protein
VGTSDIKCLHTLGYMIGLSLERNLDTISLYTPIRTKHQHWKEHRYVFPKTLKIIQVNEHERKNIHGGRGEKWPKQCMHL